MKEPKMTKKSNANSSTSAKKNVKPATNSNPLAQLEALHTEQKTWSDTLYKNSTTQLYRMLADCLDVWDQLKSNRTQRQELDHWLDTAGLKSKSDTHLTTKIVRYVFRINTKRSQIYARVLRIAGDEGIKAENFVRWVIEHGGVEEVRRQNANGASPLAIAAQIVKDAADILLEADTIATLEKRPQQLTVNTDGSLDFALALVRENKSTGAAEIVYGMNNAALIKKFLAYVGKEVIEQRKAKLSTKQQAAAADAAANARDAIVEAAIARANSADKTAIASVS